MENEVAGQSDRRSGYEREDEDQRQELPNWIIFDSYVQQRIEPRLATIPFRCRSGAAVARAVLPFFASMRWRSSRVTISITATAANVTPCHSALAQVYIPFGQV